MEQNNIVGHVISQMLISFVSNGLTHQINHQEEEE
jgi:hypothetical protein